MSNVTISKKEYDDLLDKKLRYEYMRQLLVGDYFSSPPTKKVSEAMKAFRESKRYNKEFLASLEKGLKRSAYFNK